VLIDRFLPAYDWNEVHAIEIRAAPRAVLDAVRSVTAGEIRLLGVLFGLRRLPGRLLGRPPASRASGPVLDAILRSGFVLLDEDADREVVVGTIGRFWQLRPVHADIAGPADFLAYDTPGFARAAMNFRVAESGPGRTRLSTETRIAATDAGARRRFGAYWLLVRPGSGLIRRMWLRAVRKRAEQGAAPVI
jgi:hypothetical protein